MSVMGASTPAEPDGARTPRVRDMAREAMARMVFSAAVSCAVALGLLALAHGLGR